MSNRQWCVAIYQTHDQADEAFSRLQVMGFGTNHLSFIARDYWKDMVGSRNSGKRFSYRGVHGPFWERLWSVLEGWGVFWFFEDGPVLVAGSLALTIVATQELGDKSINTGKFESGLSGIGIPPGSLIVYEKALRAGQILVFIEGVISEIYKAQEILNETRSMNHTIYHGTEE